MTVYLLPAPQIAGLLPAWSSPAPLDRIQPSVALTAAEEAILLTALYHHEAAQEPGYRCADDTLVGWLPVHKASRTAANDLILYGYLKKHPDKRKRMWYALTDDGLYRAQLLAQVEDAAAPLPAGAAPQDRLLHQRRTNLHKLVVELSMQGFKPYAEAGRGPSFGEQAFYNVFTREVRLYRCPLGMDRWRERTDGYYAASAVPVTVDALAIPF